MAETGRKRVGSEAKRKMAAPLLAARLPHATIAQLLEVSERTVGRWAGEESVRADVASIADTARQAGEDRIASLVREAFDALLARVADDSDPRVQLDAAKTILDRFGHPVASKAEVTGKDGAPVGGPTVLLAMDVARQLAREGGDE